MAFLEDWIGGDSDGWLDPILERRPTPPTTLAEAEALASSNAEAPAAAPEVPEVREGRPKVVIEHPRVQCPVCKGFDVVQTGTKWPIRHYRCRARGCKRAFQTMDKGPRLGGAMGR